MRKPEATKTVSPTAEPGPESSAGQPAAVAGRRQRGRPSDGPLASGERMLDAVSLFRQKGATKAAEELGVTRQTVYNALRAYKKRMAAVAALGQPSDLHVILEDEQVRWRERQAPNARQRRYAARSKTQGGAMTTTRAVNAADKGRASRLPAHLRHYVSQLKGRKRLCGALMTALRHEAGRHGRTFNGWTDARMAQELSRLTQRPVFDDLPRIARALCLEWGVRQNEFGYWIPDTLAPPAP